MTPELTNYVRRCAAPRFLAEAVWRFATRARAAVALRVLPHQSLRAQPASVRRAREAMLAYASEPNQPIPVVTVTPRSLTLTATTVHVVHATDWRQSFGDAEVASSLHRWNWLLYGVTTDAIPLTREAGLSLMRSWLRACAHDAECTDGAYTTSERLANGLLFLMRDGNAVVPGDLAGAFRQMGRHIAERLEYHADGMTGNHAFNNARALLMAGAWTDMPGARDLAYAIAAERLPVLVTHDGFMREGSSHYHLLFTRWVLEMLWVARRTGDSSFVDLLASYASRLVARCWFFLIAGSSDAWQLPLIGDVSPDFPPEWLVSLPWSPLALDVYKPAALPPTPRTKGWASLLGTPASGSGALVSAAACYPSDGWCRTEAGDWTLFVRARSHDGVLRAGHEHVDLGSYAVFRAGRAVVVDCGRHDYTMSDLGLFGRGPEAHNAPLVESLGSFAYGPSWLAESYTAVRVALTLVSNEQEQVVTVAHDGFSRLAGRPVGHYRKLSLSPTGLNVEDHFTGSGERVVACHVHFGPDVQGAETGTQWQVGEARGSLRFEPPYAVERVPGVPTAPHGGFFFPAYGQRRSICTLKATGRLTLPATLVHAIAEETV